MAQVMERIVLLACDLAATGTSQRRLAAGAERLAEIFQQAGLELQGILHDFSLHEGLAEESAAVADLLLAWREVGEVGVVFASRMLTVGERLQKSMRSLEIERSQRLQEAERLQRMHVECSIDQDGSPSEARSWLPWRRPDTASVDVAESLRRDKLAATNLCLEHVEENMAQALANGRTALASALEDARNFARVIGEKMIVLRSGWKGKTAASSASATVRPVPKRRENQGQEPTEEPTAAQPLQCPGARARASIPRLRLPAPPESAFTQLPQAPATPASSSRSSGSGDPCPAAPASSECAAEDSTDSGAKEEDTGGGNSAAETAEVQEQMSAERAEVREQAPASSRPEQTLSGRVEAPEQAHATSGPEDGEVDAAQSHVLPEPTEAPSEEEEDQQDGQRAAATLPPGALAAAAQDARCGEASEASAQIAEGSSDGETSGTASPSAFLDALQSPERPGVVKQEPP